MEKQGKPIPVFTAENLIKDAVAHYLLFPFNFPYEATMCIPLLFQSVELLLREYFKDKFENISDFEMKKLTDLYRDWDEDQRKLIHWLRLKRNALQHKCEVQWEEVREVDNKIKSVFICIGDLYEDFGFSFIDAFIPLERTYLWGKEPHWVEKSEGLIQAATKQCDQNPEIAIQIANKSFELALRGLASVLKIESAENLSIPDLITKMDENEDARSRASTYWDKWEREGFKGLGQDWFTAPMNIHELKIARSDLEFSEAIRVYVNEVRKVILAYYDKKEENE